MPIKITSRFATPQDTAKALGVSPTRFKRIMKLIESTSNSDRHTSKGRRKAVLKKNSGFIKVNLRMRSLKRKTSGRAASLRKRLTRAKVSKNAA